MLLKNTHYKTLKIIGRVIHLSAPLKLRLTEKI